MWSEKMRLLLGAATVATALSAGPSGLAVVQLQCVWLQAAGLQCTLCLQHQNVAEQVIFLAPVPGILALCVNLVFLFT